MEIHGMSITLACIGLNRAGCGWRTFFARFPAWSGIGHGCDDNDYAIDEGDIDDACPLSSLGGVLDPFELNGQARQHHDEQYGDRADVKGVVQELFYFKRLVSDFSNSGQAAGDSNSQKEGYSIESSQRFEGVLMWAVSRWTGSRCSSLGRRNSHHDIAVGAYSVRRHQHVSESVPRLLSSR